MINTTFNIISSETTFDAEGSPIFETSDTELRGHAEIKSVKEILKDESVIFAKKLTIRVTDASSIKKLKEITNATNVLYQNESFQISEIRKYYTYIEIIC